MPNPKNEIRIVQKRLLDKADYEDIYALQTLCENADQISLKLELDYKLADAQNRHEEENSLDVNEFLYYFGSELIGYLGICGFGGKGGPLELTGMVHPKNRRAGVFNAMARLALAECKRRNVGLVLGLCDRKADAGQALLKKQNALPHHSEYEMFLRRETEAPSRLQLRGIALRKAVNADADEIAKQDTIYFGDEYGKENEEAHSDRVLLPEDEEKRGFTIYLAVKDGRIIGKVNLQLNHGLGGIYGLGVLPEERGRGYGRAILLLAVQKLKEMQTESIFLQVLTDNEKALGLYKSCGFETSSVMDYFKL